MPFRMSRSEYAAIYGPTTGDRIRLGDTDLVALIEGDDTSYGNEVIRGWQKTLRAGMMVAHSTAGDSELDVLITNVIVMDPVMGIFKKASIGIKDGIIVGIGRAGNPDIMDDVDLVIGRNTNTYYGGDGLIATPGGIDSHVHMGSPRLNPVALSSGMTTFIGAGLQTNGHFIIRKYFEGFEHLPVNVGVQAIGSSTHPSPMIESMEAGACGFKVHEDAGAYPHTIDTCLQVADEYDVSVSLHTDAVNESMQVTDTIEAIGGRSVHAYHVEGAGGGHAPDLLRLAGVNNIIPSSTTPTVPYTAGTYLEHFPMTRESHGMKYEVPSDGVALDERLRRESMAAEDVLHDMGAIPIINSDSQGMGRIGEVITRTWQLAHKMKRERGATNPDHDNDRILQYLAKYTINPAITHGISDYVGSLEPGKMADIVLWRSAYFGIKPEMVIKGGFVSWGLMGDGNATIRNCEPVIYGPSYGGIGHASSALSAFFVSQASIDTGLKKRLGSRKELLPVKNVRGVTKRDMVGNSLCPNIEVDLQAKEYRVDGQKISSEAVKEVPLNRLYLLS